jgi:hypothetical protein
MRTPLPSLLALALVALVSASSGLAGQTAPNRPAAVADDAITPAIIRNARPVATGRRPGRAIAAAGTSTLSASSATPGVDSIVNWTDKFVTPGFDDHGNFQTDWPYTMVGRPPESDRTTAFNAPVIPVVVELLDSNGTVRIVNGKPLRQVVGPAMLRTTLQSPIFDSFAYASGTGQFTDQMMRTMFSNRLNRDDRDPGDDNNNGWHNILKPSVKTTRAMQIPRGKYRFALNDDGTCCFAVLVDLETFVNKLFPVSLGHPAAVIGQAQAAGDMTTRDITTLLFNSVYLYDTTPDNCCIIGFHSYDFEPGDARNGNRERRFVMNFASYIQNGFFSGGFEDVAAFSHEMAELFADPFVDNATPWWLSVDPFSGNALCQNNLETGDVVEVLTANPIYAAALHGRTYHLQNEALLQWFAFESPSSALGGAYSFPDETTVTTLSPGPLLPGCKPAG